MPPTAASEELFATLERVSLDLGLGSIEPFVPGSRKAADGSLVAGLVDASMDGLGVHGEGAHAPGESGDLASFCTRRRRPPCS